MRIHLVWATPDADTLIRYSGDPPAAAMQVSARFEFVPGTPDTLVALREHFDRTVPAVDLHRNCVVSFQREERGFVYATASIAAWAAYAAGGNIHSGAIEAALSALLPWAWPNIMKEQS